MFGYVIPHREGLSEGENARYKAFYCGVCNALKRRFGTSLRFTLTYDMAFAALLLNSLEEEDAAQACLPCPRHPLKKQACIQGPAVDYAADMNVLMSYYQLLDDWRDERAPAALTGLRLLKGRIPALLDAYPRQARAVQQELDALHLMEAAGETNPDRPAAAFGRLLAAVLCAQSGHESNLAPFAEALGRLVYLMDAACDLTEDLKKERYNPLTAIPSARHEGLLRLQASSAARLFGRLPIRRDQSIMENILYAGIWTRLMASRPQGGKKA